MRLLPALALLALAACTSPDAPPPTQPPPEGGLVAFTGATVWAGGDAEPLPDAVLLVRDGRVEGVFARGARPLPEGAREVDLGGRFVVPGLINAHGHVGMADGLETGPAIYSAENVRAQLRLYARYGITTVVSLGDEPPQAFEVRDAQNPAAPGMARLSLSGPVVEGAAEDSVRAQVRARAAQGADWTKTRVDDQLGTEEKMPERAYAAAIDESHRQGLPHASHMVTLADAKRLLERGADLLAHSVRDAPVDEALIALMREGDRCITPTLTREVSTYVYAARPAFFDDPFFLAHADPSVIAELERPEKQAEFTGREADYYRAALPLATRNMMAMHRAGVRVAMGTDSGPPGRFQGYFEHVEMTMMQEAGMTPREVLRSATDVAAACMGLSDLGRLTPGAWADFVVLGADPLADVAHLRQIAGVYLAGVQLG